MTIGEWFKSGIDNESLASMIMHTSFVGCKKCIASDICNEADGKTCLETITKKLDEEYTGD